jgi:hydroxylamine reductase
MITKDMTIAKVMDLDRSFAAVFFQHGLMCFGCPSATRENLEEACQSHGLDLEILLKNLNNHYETIKK